MNAYYVPGILYMCPHEILMTTLASRHCHLYVTVEIAQIQRGGGLTKDSQLISFQSTTGTQSLHLVGLGVKEPGSPPWGHSSTGGHAQRRDSVPTEALLVVAAVGLSENFTS